MRRAFAASSLIAALGACGSPPTAQESNLEERATGSGAQISANAAMNDPTEGGREGIGGATQGPTAPDSDAPHAGDDSSTTP